MRVGLIGFGNMGSALAHGFKNLSDVLVYDKEGVKKELALELGFGVVSDMDFLIGSDFIVVAVKPKDVAGVLSHLKGRLKGETLVSIVAGLSVRRMKELVGDVKIIRTMPNLAVKVGTGAIAFCVSEEVDEETKEKFLKLFSSCGKLYQVEEELMDSFTALAGSGPAFVFKFISALAMAGVMEGLSYPVALDIAVQTVMGSCKLLELEDGHPEEWISKVTSPGGTTIEGIKVLEERGFTGAIMECIRKTSEKSKRL